MSEVDVWDKDTPRVGTAWLDLCEMTEMCK